MMSDSWREEHRERVHRNRRRALEIAVDLVGLVGAVVTFIADFFGLRKKKKTQEKEDKP